MREQTDKCINGWMGRKKGVYVYGWIDGFMGRWESEWGDGEGRLKNWMDE